MASSISAKMLVDGCCVLLNLSDDVPDFPVGVEQHCAGHWSTTPSPFSLRHETLVHLARSRRCREHNQSRNDVQLFVRGLPSAAPPHVDYRADNGEPI
jgi:hypothetical protein